MVVVGRSLVGLGVWGLRSFTVQEFAFEVSGCRAVLQTLHPKP